MLNHSKSFQLKMVLKRNPFKIPSSTFKQSTFKLKEAVSSIDVTSYLQSHQEFLKDVAKVDVPKRLQTLLELLTISGGEELVNPRLRSTLNPFLIPISKNKIDNSMLCYIRWPTQKDEMDLQLVRSTDCGMRLVSLSTDHYSHRLAVELDFNGNKNAQYAIDLLNSNGELYKTGDYLTLLKSGKFPAITEHDLRLILDRYLLLKVGGFPDCYERLATNFLKNDNDVSALVTCERAVSVFYSWGHPIHFHTKM